MKDFFTHVQKNIFRGFLAVIPLALTLLAIRFLYLVIDRRTTEMIGFYIPGLGILILLTSLYLLGLVASNVIGHKVLGLVEKLTKRIPLLKTTYQVGKQLSSTLSLPSGEVFKRAVLVEYLMPGISTLGFVTGTIIDRRDGKEETLLKVFIPTPPNPASGTMVIVRECQTRDPGCSIEEAIKTVISGGIIGLKELR